MVLEHLLDSKMEKKEAARENIERIEMRDCHINISEKRRRPAHLHPPTRQ